MKTLIFILAIMSGCSKEPQTCYLNAFGARTCVTLPNGVPMWYVTEKWQSDYPQSSEECEMMAKRMREENKDVYYLEGKVVPIEELIFCNCEL